MADGVVDSTPRASPFHSAAPTEAEFYLVPQFSAGYDSRATSARQGLAALLHSIWPENGTAANRFDRLQRSSATIFVLWTPPQDPEDDEADCRVIGSSSFRRVGGQDGPELEAVADACWSACVIFSLLVDAQLQGKGLGSAILQRTEAEAAQRGYTHAFLGAEAHLVSFYEKHGYEVVSEPGWKQRTKKPQTWMRKALATTTTTATATNTPLPQQMSAMRLRGSGAVRQQQQDSSAARHWYSCIAHRAALDHPTTSTTVRRRNSCCSPTVLVFLVLLLLADRADAIVSSRKILLLHGSGGSAGAFLNHGALGIQGAAKGSYHDGGRLAWLFGAIDWDVGLEDDMEWGEWWLRPSGEASEAGYKAADKAIATIEDTIREGDYDGIVGFSEGAMIAAVIAARATLKEEGACDDLGFAVLCGGAVPMPYEALLRRLREEDESTAEVVRVVPTVHCLSKSDTVHAAAEGERRASFFGVEGSSRVLVTWHDAGHAMPSARDCKEIIAFADEAAPNAYAKSKARR